MFLKKETMIAFWLNLLATLASSIYSIYSNALFLSHYSTQLLPYFLFIVTLVNPIISVLLTHFLIKNTKEHSVFLFFIYIIVTVFIIPLSFLPYKWIPFLNAVVTGMMSALLTVISWNLITLAFSLREYKQAILRVNQGSILGAIFGSLLTSLFMSRFSMTETLILTIPFMLLVLICGFLLPTLKDLSKQEPLTKQSLWKYSLYFQFVIYLGFIVAGQTLIEYLFKVQLGTQLAKNEIGIFLGYYTAITNILGFIFSFTINKRFLQFFRIEGLLMVTPLFIVLSAILVFFFPSLWTISILMSSKPIFYYNHTKVGTEIILNILPSTIRMASKFQIKAIVIPAISITILGVLALIVSYITTPEIAISVILLSCFALYYVRKTAYAYKNTLQDEAYFRRFNLINEINEANESVFIDIANYVLKSQNIKLIEFGLSILKKTHISTLPSNALELLNHPHSSIRKQIINLIKNKKIPSALPLLLERFKLESNHSIQLLILDTIYQLNPQAALAIANQYIKDSNHPLYAGALGIIFNFPNAIEKKMALNELRDLEHHHNPSIRKEIAHIIGNDHILELENDLTELIKDSNSSVSKAAIKSAGESHSVSLAPEIIKQIINGKNVLTARKALIKMGPSIIPLLIDNLPNIKNKGILISLIAEMKGIESEIILLKLAKESEIPLKNVIAEEANYRAYHQMTSAQFKQGAKEIVNDELNRISYLQNKLQNQTQLVFLRNEIQSRIKLAKRRLLYWLAIATDPQLINPIIHSLLSTEHAQYLFFKEKALELLEISIDDIKLRQKIINIFEDSTAIDNQTITSNQFDFEHYQDDWIERIIKAINNPKEPSDMDTLTKVFNLRSVELFKDISGETLFAIAKETHVRNYNEGDFIFHEDEAADGLYTISSGSINIIRQNKLIATLQESDFFGELALLDDTPRAASAIAATDCSLLFLEKTTFDRITSDLPDVLRIVTKSVLKYLRQHLSSY